MHFDYYPVAINEKDILIIENDISGSSVKLFRARVIEQGPIACSRQTPVLEFPPMLDVKLILAEKSFDYA